MEYDIPNLRSEYIFKMQGSISRVFLKLKRNKHTFRFSSSFSKHLYILLGKVQKYRENSVINTHILKSWLKIKCSESCNKRALCTFASEMYTSFPRGLEVGENFLSINHSFIFAPFARNYRDNPIFRYCGSLGSYRKHFFFFFLF